MNKLLMKKPFTQILIGTLLVLISIPQAVILQWAHYYTIFSIGMLLVMIGLRKLQTGKEYYAGWKFPQHAIYWSGLVATCVFLDEFGLDAGYWQYPHYSHFVDEIFKYVFEWAVPFVYLGIGLLIGETYLHRRGMGRCMAFTVSLLILVTAMGIWTEFFNLYVYSWQITDMPLIDTQIGGFFIMFQTFGFWAMAIIGYSKHALIKRIDA